MNDPKLDQLFRQWRDVEPRGNFDECVQRRLRQAAPVPVQRRWLTWFGQPALATVAAVMIGLTAGAIGGMQAAPRPVNELQFMAPTTLAGAYLNMVRK